VSTPFNNPDINAQIVVEIMRLQSRAVQMDADCTIVDFDSFIVETLVDSLDVHARAYLGQVSEDHAVPEYRRYLQFVGSALLQNAEKRSHLSDPYSEERLRQIAETSGELMIKRSRLEPQQYETELQNCIEQIRFKSMPEALKWHSWKNQILARILSRFEARYLSWSADATERVMRQRDSQKDGSPTADESRTQGSGSCDQRPAATWNEVEIRFISDERVQTIACGAMETRNYAEMKCEDRRNHKPNITWITFRRLAKSGIISKPSPGEDWTTVEKAIQRLRKMLRDQFKIPDDPVPFVPGVGYKAQFKIGCSASFET